MAITKQQVLQILTLDEPTEPDLALITPEALPHLEQIVGSGDKRLAIKAAFLLGRIRNPRSLALVEKLAASPIPAMRVAAATSIRRFHPEQREATLLRLMDDVDVGVKKTALHSVPDSVSAQLHSRLQNMTKEAEPKLRDLASATMRRVKLHVKK